MQHLLHLPTRGDVLPAVVSTGGGGWRPRRPRARSSASLHKLLKLRHCSKEPLHVIQATSLCPQHQLRHRRRDPQHSIAKPLGIEGFRPVHFLWAQVPPSGPKKICHPAQTEAERPRSPPTEAGNLKRPHRPARLPKCYKQPAEACHTFRGSAAGPHPSLRAAAYVPGLDARGPTS